jgi:hypothetical protein
MYSLTGERSFGLDSFFAPTARRDQLVLKSADEALKDQVDAIKEEWRLLWLDRIDDKVRAEGIANQCFSLLSVERGTVIVATRAFKPLDLREILRSHNVQNVDRIVGPCPLVGGWTKFARTVLNKQARARRMDRAVQCRKCVKGMQLKKCGRGWLHRC